MLAILRAAPSAQPSYRKISALVDGGHGGHGGVTREPLEANMRGIAAPDGSATGALEAHQGDVLPETNTQ